MPLIQSLPGCPLDIIGDVHGQFEALQNLLHYLGYSPAGKHPQGRKLVFVGDLIDRGPDSPAVADWAKQAVNAGNAFMVLGNHEINLLAHEPKDGSGWFFDCRAGKDSRNYAPWQRQPENGKKALVQFFAEQPLVLQRSDLRIVHAAWLPESIAKLQNNATPLIQLIQEWDDELHCCIKHAPWYDDYLAEQHHHAHILENPAQHPPMLRATAAHDIYRSSRHPIRALTCGIEKIACEPFFAGGFPSATHGGTTTKTAPPWLSGIIGGTGTTATPFPNTAKACSTCPPTAGTARAKTYSAWIFPWAHAGATAKKASPPPNRTTASPPCAIPKKP